MSAPCAEWEKAWTRDAEGRSVSRPSEVRAIAQRVRQWRSEAEVCKSCVALPSVSIRGGMPLCSRCLEHRRESAGGMDARGVTPSVRTVSADHAGLAGHAIVFGELSVDLGGFRERIRASAVDRAVQGNSDLRALWNHDSNHPIGRRTAGTLSYWKDARGLAVEISPPKSAAAYVEAIERRDVTGMSFAFQTLEDDWYLEGDVVYRDVIDMLVSEVSAVTFPAYPSTDIRTVGSGARSVAFLNRVHQTKMAR